MNNFAALSLAIFSIPVSLFSQPVFEPVPVEWLRDGRLAVAELNFSIESPAADAKWSYTRDLPKVDGEGATTFIAEFARVRKFIVNVVDGNLQTDAKTRDRFIAGMKKTLPKDWEIQDCQIEVSDIPLKDSRRIKVALQLPSGATIYQYGYVVSGSRSYQLGTFSAAPSEPVAFSRFVQSFQLSPR